MEKLNIAEILKDCPSGTKLYTTVWGDVEFIKLSDVGIITVLPISNLYNTSDTKLLYSDGKYAVDGECILFPSKENRDWSNFHKPFENGDIVFYSNTIAIFKEWGDETLFRTYCVFYTSVHKSIFSFELDRPLFGKSVRKEIRLATEEEKQKLFDVIKANGYKWNAETKTLEKSIKPKFKVGDKIKHKSSGLYCTIGEYSKGISAYRTNIGLSLTYKDLEQWELAPNKFDITTLKPFDNVLMRSSNAREWTGTIFSHYSNNKFYGCGMCCDQCIPYKGNERLLGTTDDCDDYYKTWI